MKTVLLLDLKARYPIRDEVRAVEIQPGVMTPYTVFATVGAIVAWQAVHS
jgi:hypothetical protein